MFPNKDLPVVTVILAAYNGEDYLASQIQSVLNQEGVSIRLLVSVDPSDDDTLLIAEKFALGSPFIEVISRRSHSGAASKNFLCGIKEYVEQGLFTEFIAFCDQDDLWCKTKLIEAVGMLNQINGYGYSCNLTAFWESGRQKVINKSRKLKKYDFLYESASAGCTYVVRHGLLISFYEKEIVGVSEEEWTVAHDWTLYALARWLDVKWIFDERSFVWYRQHSSNVAGANSGIHALLKRIRLFFGGWYLTEHRKIVSKYGPAGFQNDGLVFTLRNCLEFRRYWLHSLIITVMRSLQILK